MIFRIRSRGNLVIGIVAGGIVASLQIAALRAGELPNVTALRSAIATRTPPRLEWSGGDRPTIAVKQTKAGFEIAGRCHEGRPVVISGRGVHEPARADCVDGAYAARLAGSALDISQEVVASQVLLDGSILAARNVPAVKSEGEVRASPAGLSAAVASAKPGDRILLEPGTYSDVTVTLPEGKGGAPGRPVVIDGNDAVTFTGSSWISVKANHVVLRGLIFRDVGPGANVAIRGSNVRVTESQFTGCGNPRKTQAECLIVTTEGAEAELDFNTFVGSKSMSIKVRAGASGAPDQPVNVSIHHNVFRDIRRLSDNGQEAIQIAGPGGGGSEALLKTRIEHNLFYRAEGDREAVSMKLSGILLRWNAFRDMDAAPNLRGAHDSTVAENIVIRTRSIRIAGKRHRVVGNILLCPRNKGSGFLVSHGSPGYGVAADNIVRDNIIASARSAVMFLAQTQPVNVAAHGNQIIGNSFYLPKAGSAFQLFPGSIADEIKATNTLAESDHGEKLCP